MVVGLAGQDDAFKEDVAHMGLTEVTLDEAKALCPILDTDAITRAAYLEAVYDIDTDLLMQTYAKDIRANGGQVLTRHPVNAITRTAEGWTVTAGGTEFTAKNIVNAAGAWVDKIAEMAGIAPIGFTPLRRSMARIPSPDGMDPATWPMVFGAGEEWYMKPDAGALIVSPAEEDPTEPHDAWADDMVLAEGLARFEENVTMEVTRLIANWAGLRTFSPDRVLVVGRDPLDETFFWCGGQGGYGFITAPAVRDLVEALVTGRDPIIGAEHIPALSPVRFR
jgi:glycine/D-amino acid oxidase-like deaminating enzyme